jgi:hypothetical protein
MKLRTVILATLLATTCAQAQSKNITISNSATWYDEKVISTNIKTECTNLGPDFSRSTKENLERDGWSVQSSSSQNVLPNGYQLVLKIANALSGGNAFLGHHKSVSVIAELYKDGKLVDTYSGDRSSGGGFGAGFKSSCKVLERCTTTLGKDVAQWLKAKAI